MQCSCSEGGCCKPCGIAKGLILIALAVLYWLQILDLRVFLSLLVLLIGIKLVVMAVKGRSCAEKPEHKAAPEKKKK